MLVIVTMAEVVVDVVPADDIVTIADEEEWAGGGGLGGGQELVEKSKVGCGLWWLPCVALEPPPPFCSPTKRSLGTPCKMEFHGQT